MNVWRVTYKRLDVKKKHRRESSQDVSANTEREAGEFVQRSAYLANKIVRILGVEHIGHGR